MPSAGPVHKAGWGGRWSNQTGENNKGDAMTVQVLDARGLNCPLPVLKAKKMMNGLQPGDMLEILATDPGAVEDFKAFSRATGHDLVQWSEDGGVFRFLIKKAG